MKITVRYNEIADFVEKKLKVRLNFVYIDEKSFEINYKPGFLPSVGVSLRVEDIEDNVLKLSYDCNKAASLIIVGAVAYLEKNIPDAVKVDTSNKSVIVDLQGFEKLEKTLKFLSLEVVYFDLEALNVIAELK